MARITIVGVEPTPLRFEDGIEFMLERQDKGSILFLDTTSLDSKQIEEPNLRAREFYKKVLDYSKQTNRTRIALRNKKTPKTNNSNLRDLVQTALKLKETREQAKMIYLASKYRESDCLVITNPFYASALHIYLQNQAIENEPRGKFSIWMKKLEAWEPKEVYVLTLLDKLETRPLENSEILKYNWVERIYGEIAREAGFGNVNMQELRNRAYNNRSSLERFELAKEKVTTTSKVQVPKEIETAYLGDECRFYSDIPHIQKKSEGGKLVQLRATGLKIKK